MSDREKLLQIAKELDSRGLSGLADSLRDIASRYPKPADQPTEPPTGP